MSRTKTEEYKYPCVYTITQRDGITFFYSSIKHSKTEKKDMFVPKVIWSNGLGTYPIIDSNGDYGLTQFSYAIIDDVHNLKNIENVLNNPKFIELMEYVKFQNNKYNYKVISLFKKDFWKEFLDKSPQSTKPIQLSYTLPLKDSPLSKKVTKRRKLKVVEPSSESKVVVENPNDSVIEKLFNPSTGRYIKNTPANRKKIQRQTLKRGGKRKKGTRKRQ